MTILNILSTSIFGFFSLSFALILIFSLYDYFRSKRLNIDKYPKISFVIPCFNGGAIISDTVSRIYESYPDLDLIIVNDGSTDNSLQLLKNLKNKYGFEIINNEENLGKVNSVNKAIKYSKNDFVFVIDVDCKVNSLCLNEAIARLLANKRIGAVSCRYDLKKTNFWSIMQRIEYNMTSIIQGSYNIFSVPALWGGCMGFKREVLEELNGFKLEAITEDIDIAFRSILKGYKVEQCWNSCITQAPEGLKKWWQQKKRWAGGNLQCMINYPKVWIKNPIYVIFVLSFVFMIFFGIINFFVGGNYYLNIYDEYVILSEEKN